MEYAIITELSYADAKKIIFENKAKILEYKKFRGSNAFKLDCISFSQCMRIVLEIAEKISTQDDS